MRWPRGPTLTFILGGPAEGRGAAVWAAAGISSWRAFSGQLAAYTVCSVASRLQDVSWGSGGPLRAAAVRIGRAALEERRAIAFRPEKKLGLGCMEIGEL